MTTRPPDHPAPRLSRADVTDALRRLHEGERRTLDTAFFGTGDPAELEFELGRHGKRRFRVVPAGSELAVRKAFVDRATSAPDVHLALLVDFTTKLPADLAARLAHGRVNATDARARLTTLFGRPPSAALLASPLKDALLALPGFEPGPIPTLEVSLEAAWRRYLEARFDLPADGALTAERLLAFVVTASDRGSDAARELAAVEGLGDALAAWLESIAGPVARTALDAWLGGEARELGAWTFLLEPLAARLDEDYVRGLLAGASPPAVLAPWLEAAHRPPLAELTVLTEPVARRLRAEGLDAVLGAVLEKADALLPQAKAEVLVGSAWLARAFRATEEALAVALERLAAIDGKDPEAFVAARAAVGRLEVHHLGRGGRGQELVERARMALRLASYLACWVDATEDARGGASYEAMLLLAERHAAHGGFVDHARRRAGGSTGDRLGRAIGALVSRVEARRDVDDRTFAAGLKQWLLAGRKADRVVPIEQAVERFVVPFLKEREERRLLIVLLDGMSWGAAVELVLDLETSRDIGLLRWSPRRASGAAAEFLPPVIAAVPTLTELSRSAFFGGQRAPVGKPAPPSSKDPERLADHAGLAKVLAQNDAPVLLLKSDLQDPSGYASDKALKLVASSRRLVAVVVNAIDDQLAAGNQTLPRFDVGHVKPLAGLLDAARQAGRSVLLASDHGHVPGERLAALPSAAGTQAAGPQGARWRTLASGEAAGPGELELAVGAAWGPPRAERIALCVGETTTYGALSRTEGKHGGVSLAEVVAPALFVGFPEHEALTDDSGLALRPVPRPAWWDATTASRPPAPAGAEARPAPAPAKRRAPEAQGSLSFGEPAAPSPAPGPSRPGSSPGPEIPSELQRVLSSRTLADLTSAKQRDTLVRPALVALFEEGRTSEDQLARALGRMPYQVGGLVAQLAEILNMDSVETIRHDPMAKQVLLDRQLLRELFE